MTLAPVESERFSLMEQVAEYKLRGENDTAIAKILGIRRAEVKELYGDFKDSLSNDAMARDMARDHLHTMSMHYDQLIRKFYELVDDINDLSFNTQVAGQKTAALKAIADLEAKRLEQFQKAGLLDSATMGDEMARLEEQHEILINILRDDLCKKCKVEVAYKLSNLTGKAETIDVEVVNV